MSGIEFIEISWRNFLSYGNNVTTLSLNFKTPTLIVGKNIDHSIGGEVDSNGSGKTTIINAIAYCLYDTVIGKDRKVDDLINWFNGKNMEVSVVFKRDKTYYKIERYRKYTKKGGNGVKIFKNTQNKFDESHDITMAGTANKQIIDIIGKPFDVFSRIILISASHTPFLSLHPTSRKEGKPSQVEIIEELFSITELSNKADTLKLKISTNNKEYDRLSELNEQIIIEQVRTNKLIEETSINQSNWGNEHKNKIERIETMIKQLSSINYEEEKTIFDQIIKLETKISDILNKIKIEEISLKSYKDSIIQFNNWKIKNDSDILSNSTLLQKLSKINFDHQEILFKTYEDGTDKLKDIQNKENLLKSKENDLKNSIKKLEEQTIQLKLNKCPYCSQEYKEAQDKLKIISIELDEKFQLLKETSTKILNKFIEIRDLSDEIEKIKIQLSFISLNELLTEKSKLDNAKSKDISLKESKNPYIITNISENDMNLKIKELSNSITSLRAKIQNYKSIQKFSTEKELYTSQSQLDTQQQLKDSILNETNPHTLIIEKFKNLKLPEDKSKEINDLKNVIDHQEFLYKLLTKKDSFIRKALLNKNLPLLNTRLKNYLDKIGLPHKVQFNYDMTISMSIMGKEVKYSSLSGGQEARINIALSFAFRDILQARHEKINLCVLDECLDTGLGNVGVRDVVSMVKKIAKEEKIPMLIISHRDEISSMFDSKIEVELNNKFSNITKSDIPYSSN